jgi:hypothetical protein
MKHKAAKSAVFLVFCEAMLHRLPNGLENPLEIISSDLFEP